MNAPKLLTAAAIAGLVAVPAVAATTPPPQKKGATYTGITSQGKTACHSGGSNTKPCTVVDKVTKDGKKVRSTVHFTAACADGNVYQDSTVFDTLKIAKGKYAAKGPYDETLSDGTKVTNHVQTHGTFKHRNKKFSVTGDFTVASDVTYTDGSTTHCASGKVTFTAKAK
ncbi:MAG: hypothetical protein QOC77_2827 [Thermoleophilaceae bacterium]|jgi:hypothetical protein|nr:hypothetical protein [Thermoleophilaceae bacterium]